MEKGDLTGRFVLIVKHDVKDYVSGPMHYKAGDFFRIVNDYYNSKGRKYVGDNKSTQIYWPPSENLRLMPEGFIPGKSEIPTTNSYSIY